MIFRAEKAAAGAVSSRKTAKFSMVAAGVWSLAFGLSGAYWAVEGTSFPLGRSDPRGSDMGSFFATAEPGAAGVIIAVTGVLGAVAAALLAHAPRAQVPRAVGALLAVALLVGVPDIRVIQNFGYLFMGYTELWDRPLLFMLFSILGGGLWALVVWNTRGDDVSPGRWGRWVTYAAAVLALPYAISRISWALGIPLGVPAGYLDVDAPSAGAASEFVLGGLCVVGAVLTLGLVQGWGEVFPRWVPFLRGRRVPIWLAVVPATAASVLLIQAGVRLWLWWGAGQITLSADHWGTFLPGLFWLPWSLALAAATYAYYLRRRAGGSSRM
ncbi:MULTISPECIES: hypothetical protein [Streptosporangium]|uniref:DUF3995 domain-containing protein n=1 Tax=Streptosporangium brasiliense TaxID=47480 RepID=A0ABT9QYL2_9ACTN|nr:hypothetical protein [Streptosporangium brasiliense]MDP9862022.1 hypothetical protein [Streptosporangium brasiliense]